MKKNKILGSLLVMAAVLCVSGQVATQELKKVEAASNITSGTWFFLTPNSNWKVDNARFAIYFFGDGDAWVSMTDDDGDGTYQAQTPGEGKNFTNLIFCRMNPTSTSNGWSSKWNQTSDLTYDGENNGYTVKEGTWDNGGGTWWYTEPPKDVKEYTITYYGIDGKVETTKTVTENTEWNSYFVEEEGYSLEGWYTDSSLTKEFVKGSKITSNISLYPNYVPAEDYTIYLDTAGVLTGDMNAYMWSDTHGNNNTWPGSKLTKNENGLYELSVDASKSFDKIIFNNGTSQTVDLDLAGAANMDTYKLTKDGTNYGAELVKTGASYEVKALFNDYYGIGYYNKHTIINLTDAAKEEAKFYFHAKVNELERNTAYEGDSLTMTIPGNATYSSTYGTNEIGMPHYSNGSTTPDYTVKGTSMEEYYVTLYDFATAEVSTVWTYNNGVYETTDATVIDQYRNFVAPLWVGDVNYIDLVKATVEVEGDNLVMKLYADATNSELISNEKLVFAKATVTKA